MPPLETLTQWFGLTKAEGRVARELAAGRPPGEIGDLLGIATRTARTQLQAVYEKTGARRQAELVKLLLTSPSWVLGKRGPHRDGPEE